MNGSATITQRIIERAGPITAVALILLTIALAYRARRTSWTRGLAVLAVGLRIVATTRGALCLVSFVVLAAIQGRMPPEAVREIAYGQDAWLPPLVVPAMAFFGGALLLAVTGVGFRGAPEPWYRRIRDLAPGGLLFLVLWRGDQFIQEEVRSAWSDIDAGISRIEFRAEPKPTRMTALEGALFQRIDIGYSHRETVGLAFDALGNVWSWPIQSKSRVRRQLVLPASLSTMGLYEGGGCGLSLDGRGVCWADPGARVGIASGQPPEAQQPADGQRLRGIETTVGCSANRGRVCALREDGRALCWNIDNLFQLQDEWTLGTDVVVMTTAFGCGGCVARDGGAVRCSMKPGANGRALEGAVDGARNVVSIDSDLEQACAIQEDGALLCWELGASAKQAWMRGSGELAFQARHVLEGVLVKQVAVGSGHSCAVTVSGKLFCWGLNTWGQLGDGTTENRLLPVEVKGIDAVERVSVGGSVTCAVHRGGIVSCWGMRRRFDD